jgi:hypothetical protein
MFTAHLRKGYKRKGRTKNPSSRRRFSKNGNIVNFSKHLSISRNIINSETNNNEQVNKFPQIKVLLVGVCCREGFVTLPEVGCKHWEGLQTLRKGYKPFPTAHTNQQHFYLLLN